MPADKLYAEPYSDLGDLGSLAGLSGLQLSLGPPHSTLPEPGVFISNSLCSESFLWGMGQQRLSQVEAHTKSAMVHKVRMAF